LLRSKQRRNKIRCAKRSQLKRSMDRFVKIRTNLIAIGWQIVVGCGARLADIEVEI
jgi:hypothetical protein